MTDTLSCRIFGGKESLLSLLLAGAVGLPLCFCHLHEKVFIFDRYERGQGLHSILKIRIKQNFAQRLNQGCTSGMKNVKTGRRNLREWSLLRRAICFGDLRGFTAKKQEDIPHAKLRGERDG